MFLVASGSKSPWLAAEIEVLMDERVVSLVTMDAFFRQRNLVSHPSTTKVFSLMLAET